MIAAALLLGQARPSAVLIGVNEPLVRQVLAAQFALTDSKDAKEAIWQDLAWAAAQSDINAFVPRLREQAIRLKSRYPGAALWLLLPEGLDSNRASLVRQAAREAGARILDPSREQAAQPSKRLALSVYNAVVTGKSSHDPWKVVSFSSQEPDEGSAEAAIDGDPDTYWHTQYSPKAVKPPHEMIVDLGRTVEIGGFSYLPRQDGGTNGNAKEFEFSWSLDGKSWLGTVGGVGHGGMERTSLLLPRAAKIRFFRFRILTAQNGGPYGSAAELDVLPAFMASEKR